MPKFADNTHGYQIFNGTEAKYIMKRCSNALHTDLCIHTHTHISFNHSKKSNEKQAQIVN